MLLTRADGMLWIIALLLLAKLSEIFLKILNYWRESNEKRSNRQNSWKPITIAASSSSNINPRNRLWSGVDNINSNLGKNMFYAILIFLITGALFESLSLAIIFAILIAALIGWKSELEEEARDKEEIRQSFINYDGR